MITIIVYLITTGILCFAWYQTLKLQKSKFNKFLDDIEKEYRDYRKNSAVEINKIVVKNLHRYGLSGSFDFDEDLYGSQFSHHGKHIDLEKGIIQHKQMIEGKQTINSLAKMKETTGKDFITTPEVIEDKYLVHIYIQSNMQEILISDKNMYDNIESGDTVYITLLGDKSWHSIGYKLKDIKRENRTKKLDMERV